MTNRRFDRSPRARRKRRAASWGYGALALGGGLLVIIIWACVVALPWIILALMLHLAGII